LRLIHNRLKRFTESLGILPSRKYGCQQEYRLIHCEISKTQMSYVLRRNKENAFIFSTQLSGSPNRPLGHIIHMDTRLLGPRRKRPVHVGSQARGQVDLASKRLGSARIFCHPRAWKVVTSNIGPRANECGHPMPPGPMPSPVKKCWNAKLVGTGRFELPTPRTPSECSTRLSHVPTQSSRLG
jgi:hypothetical protein